MEKYAALTSSVTMGAAHVSVIIVQEKEIAVGVVMDHLNAVET